MAAPSGRTVDVVHPAFTAFATRRHVRREPFLASPTAAFSTTRGITKAMSVILVATGIDEKPMIPKPEPEMYDHPPRWPPDLEPRMTSIERPSRKDDMRTCHPPARRRTEPKALARFSRPSLVRRKRVSGEGKIDSPARRRRGLRAHRSRTCAAK